MSATMFDRTAFEDQEVAVTIPLPSRRSRRLSMPSTMPSSLRRRSRLPTPSPSDGERTVSDKAMPHIPFASPPYMPIFGASSSSSSLVSSPPSRTKADVRRSMPISLHSASATPSTPSQTSSRPRHLRTESSRFRRRLARWTSSSSRDELDFGCAGNNSNSNWLEGPQDLGDTFYSQYPGTAKRDSTSSVETPTGAWTHARGESTSSTLSIASTAASSMPNSPVLRQSSKLRPSPSVEFAPATSSVRSSTPASQRKIEEEAAIEAVNEHFRRVRLSQLEQHRAQALSQFTFPQRPTLDVASSGTKAHQRSRSDELEIEFLESGHSTFTPLDAHSEADGDESIYISYDDLSDSPTFCAADVTPVPRMTFDAIPEADETAISSASSSARPSLAEATVLAPGIEEDLVPALEELSDYFVSTLASEASSGSTTAAVTPIEWVPAPILPLAPTRRKAAAVSAPDLSTFAFPPKDRMPPVPFPQHHRGNSTASLPCTATPRSPSIPSRHKRGESASFVAAQRARLVAAGRIKPNANERHLKERHSLYDWI